MAAPEYVASRGRQLIQGGKGLVAAILLDKRNDGDDGNGLR